MLERNFVLHSGSPNVRNVDFIFMSFTRLYWTYVGTSTPEFTQF